MTNCPDMKQYNVPSIHEVINCLYSVTCVGNAAEIRGIKIGKRENESSSSCSQRGKVHYKSGNHVIGASRDADLAVIMMTSQADGRRAGI
jgi:hypothetical protein